jgi:8-oxo-dGTP diphosphatase
VPDSLWLAASCHGTEELRKAQAIGADFAVLGPVKATATHAGAPALGWDSFARWVDEAVFPVYALGGMTWKDTGEAKRRGAQGIAAIRGFLERSAP